MCLVPKGLESKDTLLKKSKKPNSRTYAEGCHSHHVTTAHITDTIIVHFNASQLNLGLS